MLSSASELDMIKNIPTFFRGIIYSIIIFLTEFITGFILKKHKACPWDYSDSKYNIKGIIRLDYAPLWFIVGLIYEKILTSQHRMKKKRKIPVPSLKRFCVP